MTSIERTAYPQFKRLTSARMLHVSFTPNADEISWARERISTPEALFAVVLALKCYQKMARFPRAHEIPDVVVDHVRRCLDLGPDVEPDHGAGCTTRWHRKQIRARQGVTNDPPRARTIAAEAIREAARVKNHPSDLINVALDRLVEASLELPGFTTLDEMATRIRAEVNSEIFAGICERAGEEGQARLQALLSVAEQDTFSMFNRLKKPAQRASWSRFKAQAAYMAEVDAIGDTDTWLEGVAPTKVADFAGEADSLDAAAMGDYAPFKRLALVACLVHTARMRSRDDLAEMLCKRVAANTKKAKAELEEIRERQRVVNERLIGTYRGVLEHLDPDGPDAGGETERAQRAAQIVEAAGGFAAQLADIEEVSAFHGDNYEVLVHRFFKKDRAVMFDLVGHLELKATSSDDSVLAALEHAREYAGKRRDFIPLPPPVERRIRSRGSASPRATGGAWCAIGAGRGWWSGATSRRWCSATWPRSCAPATSPSSAPTSTPTGRRTCSPGKSASSTWPRSAPRSACRRPPKGSSPTSSTGTWTPPWSWSRVMRTTPTCSSTTGCPG